MSRLSGYLTLLLSTSMLLCSCAAPIQNKPEAVALTRNDGLYTTPKQIRYSYTLKNTTGQVLTKADFWTYAPIPQTSHQKVVKIHANLAYTTTQDELGNEMLHFEIANLPPYGMKIVSITVDLLMAESPVAESVGSAERFIKPEPHIESNDAQILSLAKSLHDTASPAQATKSAYTWVADHVFAESYIPEDRGALYALETHKGDCTEFAYLLTALYRAQGIPARPIGGYVFTGNDVVKPADFHNWTEFYAQGAWQLADAQKGAYEEKQTNYIAMRRITADAKDAFNAQRFSYAGDGLEVNMN